ncbi:MAG: PocR ligand-binding domain-containing protein [bacterium]
MESVLDEKFTLVDLVDPAVLKEICEAYASSFEVGVQVVSKEGKLLVSVFNENPFPNGNKSPVKIWEKISARLYTSPAELQSVVQTKAYGGMRFALFPLQYEFETLGRVIIGPYRSLEKDGADLSEKARQEISENQLDPDDVLKLPAIEQSRLRKMTNLLAKVMDGFLFINAKRLITTKMHMDTLFESREKIFKEVEKQDSQSQEDKEEIEKLKNMF